LELHHAFSQNCLQVRQVSSIQLTLNKMENKDGIPFPHGSVLKKFEGTIYQIGDQQFRPTRIRREQLEAGGIARRDATFDAENVQTKEPVVLKIRAEY
jgi:hypothetical protein